MREENKPQQSRSSSRISCNQEFATMQDFLKEYATNLSRSGVFIRAAHPYPVGTLLKFEFTIITNDGFETIHGIGEVTRVSQTPRGMGVAFTELEPESQDLIESLFAKHKKK